jgi:ATP-binding cassette subfamily C protein LapB
MNPFPAQPPAATAAGALEPVPLHEAVVFLARFFGTPVALERLREALVLAGDEAATTDALQALLRQAGLAGTALDTRRPRRATELPALLLDGERALLVLSQQADGGFECHLPGIEGSRVLDAATLAGEWPAARWFAVRPLLHFDQRSLLYTLPQPGRWFWDTFNRNRWMFGWALLGTLALNVFGALLPFYSMAVYDRVIPHNALGSLGVLTSAALLLAGFELVMKLLRSHLLEAAARRIDVALSAQVFAQALRMRADARPASGGVLANTVRDFEAVRDFFATGTLTVLGDLPFMLLYLGVIAMVGGPLVAVPLLGIPLLLGIAWAARRPLERKVGESMQESSQRTAHLFETMNALDTVKALGAEAWARRKWESLTQAIAHNSLETREITARVNYLSATILALANVAVVGIGAWLATEQALTLGQIIAVGMLAGRALAPASQIASLVLRWEQTRLSFAALNKIMAAPTDGAGAGLEAPPLQGAIEFREVTFAYPKQPNVVEKLNLRIRAGERVGVIGRLGSGKSTLLKLILNQYAPASGSVLVDDLVVTQLDPLSLRRQVGYVPQDVTLFHGTLRENVELGRVQGDDAALLAAMRASGLDEIVAQLPEGVGTQVGERGDRLSGGQRQAVAIARALLNRPRLLLLDEPSSMADPATEQKLIQRLRALPDTTIVLVTHRMAMLALVDRLVVMERGRVVADGPRDEVLKALAQPGAGRGAVAGGTVTGAPA